MQAALQGQSIQTQLDYENQMQNALRSAIGGVTAQGNPFFNAADERAPGQQATGGFAQGGSFGPGAATPGAAPAAPPPTVPVVGGGGGGAPPAYQPPGSFGGGSPRQAQPIMRGLAGAAA